ncbi:class I adenylate-forming enzyme family protein [Tomitella cavernea]|uniref:Long-chain fatty acid--CoA ligase n=1 Tax=Tomitella cavernea TaxID=1387982 RepID=A0ABP9CNI2_9ACTN|nr:AMP-binding protein [Tomitella cavernea]
MTPLHGQLAVNAHRIPDDTAVVLKDHTFSYTEFDEEVNRYAHALASLGVRKGDRVAVLSTNSDRFLLALYGAFRIGAIASPFNPRSAPLELHYLLTDSGASVLAFGGDTAEVVRALSTHDDLAPVDARVVSLDGADGFDDLAHLAATMPAHDPGVAVAEDDDAIIMYTSGTTGAPKGALFDHHRMLRVGQSMTALGLTAGQRQLHAAPLYHCAELALMTMTGLTNGNENHIMDVFDPVAVVDSLERHRITLLLAVPTMYQMIMRVPGITERDLSAWHTGFFGAAPMPPTAVAELSRKFPNVQFTQLCGPTEGGSTGIYSAPHEVRERPDTTGRRAVPYAQVRLADGNGDEPEVGTPGEILLRVPSMMKRYWNKPEATEAALRDGWLHTGDLAVRDEHGYFTIVDRLKDMIITGGMNVYSVEDENALAGHPEVQDVAVIGRPHETYGETIVAVVTPVEGREVTLEGLREYAADRIGEHIAAPRAGDPADSPQSLRQDPQARVA